MDETRDDDGLTLKAGAGTPGAAPGTAVRVCTVSARCEFREYSHALACPHLRLAPGLTAGLHPKGGAPRIRLPCPCRCL